MIRLFVALALPDQCRKRLVALGGGIDGARWVDVRDLHITLRFVGEVSELVIDDIVQALGGIRAAPVEIALNGAGQFASKARVRAVWVGVEKSQGLIALHEKVDRALIRIGLSPERRKYTPHVTIGRMNGAVLTMSEGGWRSMARFLLYHLRRIHLYFMRAVWGGVELTIRQWRNSLFWKIVPAFKILLLRYQR